MALTAEAFFEMIHQLDKDGDGEVSKDEYEVVFRAMFPQVSHERYEAIWTRMDRDGDGNLTVHELADYYGFDLDRGVANEMTDEQILETLSMQAALDMKVETDKKDHVIGQSTGLDPSIMTVQIPTHVSIGKTNPLKHSVITFLESCSIGDLSSSKPEAPTVLKFLEEGIGPVRCQDGQAEMPLHKLARIRVTERNRNMFELCVSKLIEKTRAEAAAVGRSLREDINHQDRNGKTPLYMAVEHGNLPMMNMLFGLGPNEGPDPLIVSKPMNWTVLHAAVQTDDLLLITTLVNHISPARVKVMLQSLSNVGRDPLHLASYHCKLEVVQFLLDAGSDKTRRDSYGNTPGKLAQRAGRRKSKELIDGQTDSFKRMVLERPSSGEASPDVSQKTALPFHGRALRPVV